MNTALPAISGTPQQSQALTVASAWSGTSPIDYSYQWQRCDPAGLNCTNIGGATGQSYLLTAGDVGATIRVAVVATNTAGSTSALSGATALVRAPPAAPTNSVPPNLHGAASVGSILSVGSGTWNGDQPLTFAYQWQRCTLSGSCQNIPSATGSSYAAAAADSGKQLLVQVTATNNVTSRQALSNLSDIVTGGPNAPTSKTVPAIAGFAQVGQTLTVSSGTWTGAPPFTFRYQWQRCTASGSNCANIPGATDQAYTLVAADSGKRLDALVTALIAAGAGQIRTSLSATVNGGQTPPENAALPVVAGVPEIGSTLQVTNGQWAGTPPFTYTYQWQRCPQAKQCTNIAAATDQTYRPGPADRGAALRAVVTAANGFGTASATSSRSAVVAASGSTGAIVLGNGLTSVPVSSLFPPDRLVIDRVQVSPAVVRQRSPFTVRFRVRDLHGRVVRGALVQVSAIPFNAVARVPEQATGTDGWATFRLRPTPSLQLQGGSSLVLFVVIRKQGEPPFAGISNRQLHVIRLGRPAP